MNEQQKEMLEDLDMKIFIDEDNIPTWLLDIIDMLLDRGWTKSKWL